MPNDNLKNAVKSALDSIGRVRTLEIAPELTSLEGWTNELLAGVMTDANDILCDERHQENILSLKEFLCSTEAARNERKPHFDMVTESLAATLHYHPYTVEINYHSGNTTKSITAVLATTAETRDYVPVVGVVVGKENGPFKAALGSMFKLLYRRTVTSALASRFATSVLQLWREVLQTWIQTTPERDNIPDIEIIGTTTAAPVARAKVQRGRAPIIEIDIEPARSARAQGVKRSRSVQEEDTPPTPRKRKAIPTPPSTRAVEEAKKGPLPFIPALIEAIPTYPTPTSESGVDIMYTFRRPEFSTRFGSGSQDLETGWKRQTKYERHRPPGAGSTDLIGGKLGFNPYFPQTPCARGLVYRAPGYRDKFGNKGGAEPHPHTVLFQVAEAKWLYLGEYVVKYKCSLPCDEWKLSTSKVSSNDLAVITAYGQLFFLRKFKDDWVDYVTDQPDRYAGPQIRPQEMRKSLDDGTLNLEVYEMQCVDYHVTLQAKIIELALDRNHKKERRACCV